MENARTDALSRRSDFISKTDCKEALFKKRDDSLEYNREIVIAYKVIKNLTIK